MNQPALKSNCTLHLLENSQERQSEKMLQTYINRDSYIDRIHKTHRGFKMLLILNSDDIFSSKQATYDYTVITPTGVVFIGKQYRPSILWKSRPQILDGLLFFLTLKIGDTDRGYFDDYTPEQLAWAQSWECELAASELSEDI